MDSETQKNQDIINKTIEFVKTTLKGAESGHDWHHINRVWQVALNIAEEELKSGEISVNLQVVQLGALLHDIADHKFHGGDDTVGPAVARKFLFGLNVDADTINSVCYIIEKISFKGADSKDDIGTIEGKIVQDSDRLDAIGAIGVARAFSYGGFKNREMYDPEDKPILNMDWEKYKNNKGCTINHFYEKLLLVKDRMHTQSARKIAEKRHSYMEGFLEEFFDEWNSKK